MQAVWAYSVLVFCLVQCVHLEYTDDEIPPAELEKWKELTHNMVHLLYRQRNEGNTQFAFVVVGELQNSAKAPESIVLERWNPKFQKSTTKYTISNTLDQTLSAAAKGNRNGEPDILDFKQTISPKWRSMYVNYVAASVMKNEDETMETTMNKKQHTEHTLLQELDALYAAYTRSKGREPNFVLMYTWIFPCADPDYSYADNGGCSTKIVQKRKQHPFDKMTWIVGYTTKGYTVDLDGRVKGLPYMNPTGNYKNQQFLAFYDVSVIQVPCYKLHLHKKGSNRINLRKTNEGPKPGGKRKIS